MKTPNQSIARANTRDWVHSVFQISLAACGSVLVVSQDMTLDAFLEHIEDKQPLANDWDIVRFERSLGVSLAADYRAFLQRCNGGYAGGSVWDFERGVGVHHVGGFRDEEHFSLRSHYDSLREFLPADMIPIADDPFGNAICLGVSGASVGKIYFWDHESAEDVPAHVADSFTAFVGRLEEQEDEKRANRVAGSN